MRVGVRHLGLSISVVNALSMTVSLLDHISPKSSPPSSYYIQTSVRHVASFYISILNALGIRIKRYLTQIISTILLPNIN